MQTSKTAASCACLSWLAERATSSPSPAESQTKRRSNWGKLTTKSMTALKIFAAFLVLRILSVFVVRTSYVPDEYWQSVEVAHRLAFGYGHLTWEWTKGIRSYLQPLCISALYRALAALSLDSVDCLVLGPRICQAILSSISDYWFYRWCGNSKWSIFVMMTSWFWFYMATRTLSNTLETCLTVMALRLYPRRHLSESTAFLWLVAVVCCARPTAFILWLPLCVHHFYVSHCWTVVPLMKRYMLIGLIVGGASIALDSYAHGSFVITPLEFFRFNVLDDIGSFYGTHPIHWYFTVGLPVVLGPYAVPYLLAAAQTASNRKAYMERSLYVAFTLTTLLCYSLMAHKEFRFVLPLLPLCLYVTSDSLAMWSRRASRLSIWIVALALLVTNAVPALYFSLLHQRGTTDVMRTVEQIAREYRDCDNRPPTVLFLMPCHSTPLYSHVHQNVSLRFLTCEPNFHRVSSYVNEADQFYRDPLGWLRSSIPTYPKTSTPSHLVLFDKLKPEISEYLKSYRLIRSVPHAEYVDDRIGHNVLVYERVDELTSKQRRDDCNAIEGSSSPEL